MYAVLYRRFGSMINPHAQATYSVWSRRLSNRQIVNRRRYPTGSRCRGFTAWLVLLLLVLAVKAFAASTLIGLPVDDASAREAVERYTLARQLKTAQFLGTLKNTDWILDRPPLAATLARRLHPPLEQYRITEQGNGTYGVDDMGALRGSLRLVARAPEKRIYFVEGQFRSLAHILNLTGSMVFTLEFRERWDGNESTVEVEPQLFLRLDNVIVHGLLKVLAPLLHGIIDRRVANLTAAAQVVSERLTKDPHGLYLEMLTWPDLRPEELEEFRQAFRIPRDGVKEGE
jgi:hypothetical protein